MQNNHHKFESLRQSPKVEVRGNGLYSRQQIEPYSILLSIRKEDTICFSNIDEPFKQRYSWLKNTSFCSKQTHIKKELDFSNEVLMLYLIYLKNHAKSELQRNWFSRPVAGMHFFDRRIVEQTQNYDLLIDYMAEHNHLDQLSTFYFEKLGKHGLSDLLCREEVDFEEFKDNYVWSYHFLNNRSFGYTDEYTLIPIFDMVNHSHANCNASQILSDKDTLTAEELKSSIGKHEQLNDFESDNQEDIDTGHIKKTYLTEDNFYYHMVSTELIRADEEIYFHYGNRNNTFLLQGYGFVEHRNPYDSLTIYVSWQSNNVYFDAVKGQAAAKFKLKRNQFNLQLLIEMKRKCFKEYYQKNPQTAKILWSKPKDKGFELFFLSTSVQRLKKSSPKLHVLSLGCRGATELMMYEHEREAIYRQQVDFYQRLLEELTKTLNYDFSEGHGHTDSSLPLNLKEYLGFLSTL